jgi:hypothetical protein
MVSFYLAIQKILHNILQIRPPPPRDFVQGPPGGEKNNMMEDEHYFAHIKVG